MKRTASSRQLLRSALLSCVAVLGYVSAQAQEASSTAVSLEAIDVNPTSSRLSTKVPSRPAREREPEARTTPVPTPRARPSAQQAARPAVSPPDNTLVSVASGIVTGTIVTGAS